MPVTEETTALETVDTWINEHLDSGATIDDTVAEIADRIRQEGLVDDIYDTLIAEALHRRIINSARDMRRDVRDAYLHSADTGQPDMLKSSDADSGDGTKVKTGPPTPRFDHMINALESVLSCRWPVEGRMVELRAMTASDLAYKEREYAARARGQIREMRRFRGLRRKLVTHEGVTVGQALADGIISEADVMGPK